MEEWVGRQWHRLITRLASPPASMASVRLADMQRPLTLLFRAGGGAPAVRLAPAGERAIGGPRGWLQRVGGGGTRAALAGLQGDVFTLPPELAVLPSAAQNRELYRWLAAVGAHWRDDSGWVAGNLAATRAALAAFPGLAPSHAHLVAAQLALRPDPASLRGAAAVAERRVQCALRGEPLAATGGDVDPADVAPVWLWLMPGEAAGACARRAPAGGDAPAATPATTATDDTRRRAEAVRDERHRAPLLMFFRAESILSWGEFVKVDRAEDDSDDGHALDAARDLDQLAIAPDGQRCASRVRFDFDLPSAAADDLPLGAGERLPEWDWKRQRLTPDHCAVQRLVAREAPPFTAPAALQATARQVRRRLEVLRAAPARARAQPDGDDIDLDAWVREEVRAQGSPRSESPAVYLRRVRGERSLATLLLADVSLSTDAHIGGRGAALRVIDVIRDALHVFGEALAAGGDPFEMLGFSSVRRQHVRIHQLKAFDEGWGARAQARVAAIRPGYYTRMGAAIRHATRRLAERPERQRLLLLLTDGKPNDLDAYEGRYGLEDTRQAVREARSAGLTPFAVTIDAQGHDYLPLLFGQQGYALVHQPRDLARRLAAVYAALTRG